MQRLGFSVVPLLLWWLSGASQAQTPSNPYSYSRTSDFSYRADGLLSSETIEPTQPQLCVVTTYNYDAYGNKADVGATKAATTANCAGASGLALITSRSSSGAYAAQDGRVGSATGTTVPVPAGTFATSAANALNQSESRIYDPRFGVAVSLTGPNMLTTSWTLDDFGRKVLETRADGTKTAMYYCWLAVTFNGVTISTASNNPGCHNGSSPNLALVPAPATNEAPADAVRYEHSLPLDAAGTTAIGAFSRIYYDRAGRKIRSVTQAFDGANQPGGTNRLIVADTDYDQYGVAYLSTQPRFLDHNSSTTGGWGDYGITMSTFDALGRPTIIYTTDPNTPQQTGGSEVNGIQFGARTFRRAAKTTITYSGLVTVTTDDSGRTRKEEKNLDGKVVRVTDSSGTTADTGAQMVHQHDAFGNLVTTKDALGNKIEIAYDIRGRKISLNDPDAGVTAYCYDALGQLKSQQSSNQRNSHTLQLCPTYNGAGSTVPALPPATWIHLAYDVLGRMTQRVEPEYISNWTYDSCTMGVGKLCQTATTNGITKKLVYDSLGRPVNTRTDITTGPSTATAVAYDTTTGRVASQRFPTGVQLSYQYTAKGYLQAVKLDTATTVAPLAGSSCTPASSCTLAAGTALWSATAVNAWGKAEQSAYANGITSSAVYEPYTGRLHNLRAGPSNAVVDQRYSWDSVNLLTQRIDAIGDQSGVQVRDDFTYDKLGRLTQYVVNGGSGANPASRTVALAYNALGMLLSKSDVGNYNYPTQGVANGRPHGVQSVTGIGTSYSYDLNGNAGTATAGKWRSITYTSFNLPGNVPGDQGIDGPAATPKSLWQYDEGHQRVKEVRINASGTRTTWYLHPDNQGGLGFEREIAPNGVQSHRHYLSAGGSAFAVLVTTGALPTLTATQTAPAVLTTIAAVKVEYWHKDQLGSLIATTDHAGAVTGRFAYDPFGKRRYINSTYDAFGVLIVDWTTDTNTGNDRGFTGHEHLDDLGLVHMNGRIFDPLIGRFLQTDPLIQSPGNLQNYDRFGYCFNNPLTCTDPSGFSFWTSFRNAFIQTAAAAADVYFCSGYCSAAVAAYRGNKAGGPRAGAIAAVVAYLGYQYTGPQASAAVNTFFAAASGCVNAEATGGKCGQGAVSGVIQSFGGDTVYGQAVAGCVAGAVTGGSCRQGAVDAVGSYAGSTAARATMSAYENFARPTSEYRVRGDGQPIRTASADSSSMGLGYLFEPELPRGLQAVRLMDFRLLIRLVEALITTLSESVKGGQDGADGEKPSLLDPKGEQHVLDGDKTGGGHRSGTGRPGKSEFPSGWSDERIKGEISDIATDPASSRSPGRGGREVVRGTRGGVDIEVIIEPNGRIVTGYPTNVPRNPR